MATTLPLLSAWAPGISRRLLQALLASLGVHALLLLPSPGLEPGSTARPPLRASLKNAPRTPPAVMPPLAPSVPEESPPPPQMPVERSYPSPKAEPAPVEEPVAQAEENTAEANEAPLAPPPESPRPSIYLAGLREYHMALGRMATQFRRYPPEAREAGMQGRVIMRLFVGENGMPLGINLLGSSQFRILDHAAIEMIRLAASHTQVPDALRGQAFNIDLAFDFTPGDEP